MIRTEEMTEMVCENCRFSRPLTVPGEPALICEHKAPTEGSWCVVDSDASCPNFDYSGEIISAEVAAALAEGAKLIPLTQDKFAIVDAEDYDRLSEHKWHVMKCVRTEYAGSYQDGKYILMHRVLLNAPHHRIVDHRDGNGLNNRKHNLRLCTHQENLYNQRPRLGGTSRFRGVCWRKTRRKYETKIQKNGKRYSLGYYHDETEAAVVYDIKAMELFGEFAYLNFPKLMRRYRRQITEDR